MKKIIFLLLISVSIYGQNATPFTKVKITGNSTSTTATKVNVQEANGEINSIAKGDLIEYLEYASAINLPVTGVVGKIYSTLDNNTLYRWNGIIYVNLSNPTLQQVTTAGNITVDQITINRPDNSSPAIEATSNGSNPTIRANNISGPAIAGFSTSTWGVMGTGTGAGVYGTSTNGLGVYATSINSVPLLASINDTNTNNIAQFDKGAGTVASVSYLGGITGNSFIKTGGTAAQFLMADGSTSIASGSVGTTETASNGLTKTVNDIQLGGTLTATTSINTSSYDIGFSGTHMSPVSFTTTNTGDSVGVLGTSLSSFAGAGVKGINANGSGVFGTSTYSTGVLGDSNSGIGVRGQSNGYYGIEGRRTDATTNSVIPVANFVRLSSGTAANGIGSSIELSIEANNNSTDISNTLQSKWTNAVYANRTSEFSITGVNNAVTSTLLTLSGNGAAKLNQYGTGTKTGIATYALQVDSSGNIIEGSVSGSGSTNLAYTQSATNGIVTSDTGTDATIPSATGSAAGLLNATTQNIGGFKSFLGGFEVVSSPSQPIGVNLSNSDIAGTKVLWINNTGAGLGTSLLNQSVGMSLLSTNFSTGVNFELQNQSSGKNLILTSSIAATGDALTVLKNSVVNFTLSDTGVSTGTSFIKRGATSDDILLGNGTTTSLSALSGGGAVTSVTAIAPVASTGGTAPVISMPESSTSANGYLTATDWNTFNNKQAAGSYLTGTKVDSFNTRTGAVSLSSADVTNALAFTPYNSSNPNSYISSFTESDPTIYAWAKAISKPSYTKSEVGLANVDNTADSSKSVNYANSAGSASANDVYAWAKASTKPSYAYSEISSTPTALSQFTNNLGNYGGFLTSVPAQTFSSLTGKPTTIAGYGITDATFLPLTGGTLSGALTGTSAYFTGGLAVLSDVFTITEDASYAKLQSYGGKGLYLNELGNPIVLGASLSGSSATFSSSVTASAFYQSSDIRLKKIQQKTYGDVTKIKAIQYTWKDKTKGLKPQVGYSAQQVQRYIPNAVEKDKDGNLSVNYIQVLVAKIEALEKRIKELEKK